jgi:hypothetical protein
MRRHNNNNNNLGIKVTAAMNDSDTAKRKLINDRTVDLGTVMLT